MKAWAPYMVLAAAVVIWIAAAMMPYPPCPEAPAHDCQEARLRAELDACHKEHAALEAVVARHEYWVHLMGEAAADGHRSTMECAEELVDFRAHAADIHGCSYRHGRTQ
jgi:hypothetical protein